MYKITKIRPGFLTWSSERGAGSDDLYYPEAGLLERFLAGLRHPPDVEACPAGDVGGAAAVCQIGDVEGMLVVAEGHGR